MSTIRTTAIFKCIVTMRGGAHKIVRMTIEKVAQMCAALREMKNSPWMTRRYIEFFKSIELDADSVLSCKFINERTGDVLIEI